MIDLVNESWYNLPNSFVVPQKVRHSSLVLSFSPTSFYLNSESSTFDLVD